MSEQRSVRVVRLPVSHDVHVDVALEGRLRDTLKEVFGRLLAGERSDELLLLSSQSYALARQLEARVRGDPRQTQRRALDLAALARDLNAVARDLAHTAHGAP